MATHCTNCGARHFTGEAATVDTCRECAQTPKTAPHSAPSPYRQELAPEGVQYVIPGCERVPVAKSGAAQLSLF